MSSCISGWSMLNKQTAMVPDIYTDERIPHDAYRPTFVKSLLMVPVRHHDPIAAIGVYWADNVVPHPDTISHLEALARSTATAIQNVQMQAQVKMSGERMIMALNAADMGAWDYDTASKTFTLSPLAHNHLGFGKGNEAGTASLTKVQSIIHPSDKKLLEKAFDKACADFRSFGVEFRLRWADGVYHWVELRGRALTDGTSTPRHIVGVTLQDTSAT